MAILMGCHSIDMVSRYFCFAPFYLACAQLSATPLAGHFFSAISRYWFRLFLRRFILYFMIKPSRQTFTITYTRCISTHLLFLLLLRFHIFARYTFIIIIGKILLIT